MACGKAKSIDEMDMVEMFGTMQALGVSFEGVNTLDEMRSRVRTVLNQAAKTSSWSAGQVRVFFLSNFRTNEFWPVLNSLHRSAILIAGRCEGKAFAVYIAIPKKIQNRLYIYSSVHFISFMYFIYLVPHKKHRFTPFDREKLI